MDIWKLSDEVLMMIFKQISELFPYRRRLAHAERPSSLDVATNS